MIIGIDNGNSQTKTANCVFKSGVKSHDLKPPMAHDLIMFDNKYYTLKNERSVYMRDKTSTNECFILTLFAIAKEIIARKEGYRQEVDLAVGLPPEHFAKLQNTFRQYFYKFGQNITFKYNDIVFNISIKNVLVFPQAYSAITEGKANLLNEFNRVYIIDIGGYTTDVLLMVDGKPDLTYCRSLEHGMISLANKVKARVSESFDLKIDDIHVENILMNKPVVFNEDVKKFVREEIIKETNEILNELREMGIDLKADPAIFIGGGALALKSNIENSKKVSKTEFIPNISANAVGYEKLAMSIINR